MTDDTSRVPDPGPSPDLTNYSTLPADAYEWFLSDHPWAAAERRRRSEAYYASERQRAADVRAWTEKIHNSDQTGSRDFDRAVRKLADMMQPMADNSQLRAQVESAEPDELFVAEQRRRLVRDRHNAGDDDYEYPPHLIGPGAAAHPPPASGFATESDRSQHGRA